jgi:hypothetical protein
MYMKRTIFLGIFTMLIFSFANSQDNVKKVSSFKEGTTLTEADLGFLSMVSNQKVEAKSRGTASVTLKGKKFTANQTLTKDDASKINSAIGGYTKSHKGSKTAGALPEARGTNGLCWYWYYYCDGYGNCWYYKYYYYC